MVRCFLIDCFRLLQQFVGMEVEVTLCIAYGHTVVCTRQERVEVGLERAGEGPSPAREVLGKAT